MMVYVQEGTQAGNVWSVLANKPDLGTDDVTFVLYLSLNVAATSEAAAISAAASCCRCGHIRGGVCGFRSNPARAVDADQRNARFGLLMPSPRRPFITPPSWATWCPLIYNGVAMVPTEFPELTLTLHSSHHTANAIFDVFGFEHPVAGPPILGTGPAWSNSAAAAGFRGAGGGSTQLTRVKGFWTNAITMTARNGSETYTVGADRGTYLGSIPDWRRRASHLSHIIRTIPNMGSLERL